MNGNRRRLIELCVKYDLVIGTLFSTKRPTSTRGQIDHIAVSRRWRPSFEDDPTRQRSNAVSEYELNEGWLRPKMYRHRPSTTCRYLNPLEGKKRELVQGVKGRQGGKTRVIEKRDKWQLSWQGKRWQVLVKYINNEQAELWSKRMWCSTRPSRFCLAAQPAGLFRLKSERS